MIMLTITRILTGLCLGLQGLGRARRRHHLDERGKALPYTNTNDTNDTNNTNTNTNTNDTNTTTNNNDKKHNDNRQSAASLVSGRPLARRSS